MITADSAAVQKLGLQHTYRLTDPGEPVIFLIHGRAGNHNVMWTFKSVIPQNYNIIAPQAPIQDPIGGNSWWNIKNSEEERLDEMDESERLLTNFLSDSLVHYDLDPPLIAAAGFSQGAVLTSILLQKYPTLFSKVALLAGLVLEKNPALDRETQLPQILIAHGSEDDVIPIEKGRRSANYLKRLGYPVEFHEDPVGHKIGRAGMAALKIFFNDEQV